MKDLSKVSVTLISGVEGLSVVEDRTPSTLAIEPERLGGDLTA